jgi:hypothetical protein
MNAGRFWKWNISLCGSSIRGTWRGESLLGTPKDISSRALEMGICFQRGSVLANMGRVSFPMFFEIRMKLIFIRITFVEEWRAVA